MRVKTCWLGKYFFQFRINSYQHQTFQICIVIVFFVNFFKLKFCHAGLGTLSTTTTGQLLQQAASPQQQQRGYSSSSKNSVATRLEHLDLESCDSVTEAGVKFILGRETLENTLKSIKKENQSTALNFKGTYYCILCITEANKVKFYY